MLGVATAALFLCIIVVGNYRAAATRVAVVEESTETDRLLSAVRTEQPTYSELGHVVDQQTPGSPSTQPVLSERETPPLIDETETRALVLERMARVELKEPYTEPVVHLPDKSESRPDPIRIEKKKDPEMRSWTSENGESFQGRFLRFRDNNIIIQIADGSVREVHPSKLSRADRQWYTSVLRAQWVAEGDERRARIAPARQASKAAKRQRMIARSQNANQQNNGFPGPNHFPVANHGYRPPQTIQHHIHIGQDTAAQRCDAHLRARAQARYRARIPVFMPLSSR